MGRKRWALIGLAVLLGACHGNSAPVSSASAPRATVSAADVPEDDVKAGKAALHLGDLPPGWTASPYRPDPNQDANDRQLAACLGLPSFKPYQTADVHSQDFLAPGGTGFPRVASHVIAFSDDRYPRRDLKAFESAELPACAESQYQRLVQRSGQQTTAVTVAVLPQEVVGNPARGAAFRATIALGGSGTPSSLVVDVISLVGPRLGVTLTLANAGHPVPDDLERQLVAVELARLKG
jgi:hypothetical protein